MKLEPSIRTELRFVAGGLLIGDALICAVFALLNKFDYTVPLGALWGSVFAWLSIFLLALRVQKVADSEGRGKGSGAEAPAFVLFCADAADGRRHCGGRRCTVLPLCRRAGSVSGAAAGADAAPLHRHRAGKARGEAVRGKGGMI